jgi:hypothetical protein
VPAAAVEAAAIPNVGEFEPTFTQFASTRCCRLEDEARPGRGDGKYVGLALDDGLAQRGRRDPRRVERDALDEARAPDVIHCPSLVDLQVDQVPRDAEREG